MPTVVPLTGGSALVGRFSASRGIRPEIDCGSDTGISRRHAQLTTDGQRWWVEDLQSSNGTFVGSSGRALPVTPIQPGQKTELGDDSRVYVGAFTRIVVRPATTDERRGR
jgi:pSer/pThr/pTyr-binding forkhead associated (FHA) protein